MTEAIRYFDDLSVGMEFESPPIPITESEIIAFATMFDPQPMHTDPRAAMSGPFGGLIASGWQLTGLAMRNFVQARLFGSAPIIGLGVDELRFRKPVRPGDVLRVRGKIMALTRSRSRPDRGIVRLSLEEVNQHADVVMSFLTDVMVPARPTQG